MKTMSLTNRRCLIALCLLLLCAVMQARPSFTPFPKAADDYWRSHVPASMRQDYIALGDSCKDLPWQTIPAGLFAEFRTNGNRTRYEAASFAIRTQFACLVMAEIMQHEGRYLSSVCQGLHYFLEKEMWWGIPAHYPTAAPQRDVQPVDLFNAETSGMLAWTLYMLGDDIDRLEPGLSDKVRSEIQRRFLDPTLYEEQGWKRNANNWNTWITSNWLVCVLLCEKDEAKYNEAIQGVWQDLRLFLKGYPDDGGCEEGVGYWDRAGASFFESLWFLGADIEREKVHAMGRFITSMHIHDLTFVNFSDAQAHNLPNINILFPYGVWLKDKEMMQLAAYIGQKYDYLHHPSRLFLASGNYPTLGRELMMLSLLDQYRQTVPAEPRTEDTFLANSQIMVASNADWFVAAKGGNNAESHNHNDIGNFIVYHGNRPVIIDLGRDTYTSLSFSSRRYELPNCRSMYHNVPLVKDVEQKDGAQYKATNVQHTCQDGLSSLSLDIAGAYPEEAGMTIWQRQVSLDRKKNCVTVQEHFSVVAGNADIVLMCYGEPQLKNSGKVLLQSGAVCLEFDKRKLSVSWEKMEMADGIMKEQWHDNVYRLLLRLKSEAKVDSVSYSLQQTPHFLPKR